MMKCLWPFNWAPPIHFTVDSVVVVLDAVTAVTTALTAMSKILVPQAHVWVRLTNNIRVMNKMTNNE